MEAPHLRHIAIPLSRTVPDAVELRCFPSDDDAFAAFVDAAVDGSTEGDLTPETLQQRLRAVHQDARVHEQNALGTLSPGHVIWYVFRDG